MRFNLNLKETVNQIGKKIQEAIFPIFSSSIKKNIQSVESTIRVAAKGWILSQPEIDALRQGGELAAKFGIPIGENDRIISQIVNTIINNLVIKIQTPSKNFSGNVIFELRPSLIQLEEDKTFSVITEKGVEINWINWLLNMGDSVVVIGWKFNPGYFGRSGGGNMIEGGSFRVPPRYSGVEGNNFVTRAFLGRDAELSILLRGLLK